MLLEINRQAVYKSRQWLLWGPMVAGWERAQSSLLAQLKRFYFVIWGVNMWIYSLRGKSWRTLSMYFPICLMSFNKILFKGGILLLENYLKLQKGSSRNVDHWKPNTWKKKVSLGFQKLEQGSLTGKYQGYEKSLSQRKNNNFIPATKKAHARNYNSPRTTGLCSFS